MSARFRFASILQLRCRERDMAAAAVEEVARAISLIDNQLNSTQAELDELAASRKKASSGNVEVGNLLDFQRHQIVLLGNTQHLRQQRSTLEQESARRDKLMKTQQAVKSFEKLRDQQQTESLRQEAEQLQSRLDEWSNTRVVSEAIRKGD